MERKKKKKVEVGAVPFALGVVVLSTTCTCGLPRRGPGLHDTDCTTLRQLGSTGFGSLWPSLLETVACKPRLFRPCSLDSWVWEWAQRRLKLPAIAAPLPHPPPRL